MDEPLVDWVLDILTAPHSRSDLGERLLAGKQCLFAGSGIVQGPRGIARLLEKIQLEQCVDTFYSFAQLVPAVEQAMLWYQFMHPQDS